MQHVINRIGVGLRATLVLCALGLGLTVPLTGCSEESIPVSITGYNHITDEAIIDFTVNGAMGMNLGPKEGGGGESCCVAIPKHWHPGLKAKVSWEYGYGSGESGPRLLPQEAEVDIPEYTPENLGKLQVHFYPNHRVKIVVSMYGLGHPMYPLPKEDWAPWKLNEDWARNYQLDQEEKKNEHH